MTRGPARRWYWKQSLAPGSRGNRPWRGWDGRVPTGQTLAQALVLSSFTTVAVLQDFRFAARTPRNQPFFSLVAVATLSLRIGASTAVVSVVDGVLLQPLPSDDPESLVETIAHPAWQTVLWNDDGFLHDGNHAVQRVHHRGQSPATG